MTFMFVSADLMLVQLKGQTNIFILTPDLCRTMTTNTNTRLLTWPNMILLVLITANQSLDSNSYKVFSSFTVVTVWDDTSGALLLLLCVFIATCVMFWTRHWTVFVEKSPFCSSTLSQLDYQNIPDVSMSSADQTHKSFWFRTSSSEIWERKLKTFII